ncbi:hypothetical protein [Leisingera sp. JC1]|uniref:hypothetical protein n=1 Tax=Leisingera sp. JC1 TaxID=1855282 RepID=UPI0008038D1D|nr:hypothetical protein [Leisingera sp. JC1]OBY28012.1 hypothetical protein A9D60_13335 [Leisingera sp. JC1]
MFKTILFRNPHPAGPLWFRKLASVYLILCGLPIFLPYFDARYLPSPEWVSSVRIFDILVVILMTCAAGFFVFQECRKATSEVSRVNAVWGGIGITIPFWIFGILLNWGPVTHGGPMLVSGLIGQEVELPFDVRFWDTGRDRSRCPNSVTVKDLPLIQGKICNLPPEFLTTLQRYDTIIVSGQGTQAGLFVSSARRAVQEPDSL